jgi:hypothetical protein
VRFDSQADKMTEALAETIATYLKQSGFDGALFSEIKLVSMHILLAVMNVQSYFCRLGK